MKAHLLRIGEFFQIPELKDSMRDLTCLRISQTAVHCRGDIKDGEEWKNQNTYISTDVNVVPDPDKPLVKIGPHISPLVGKAMRDKDKAKAKRGTEGIEEKGKRGRKKQDIEFPKEKFTIPELASKTGLSTTAVYLKVREQMQLKKIVIVGVERKAGARGKPTTIYATK